WLAYVSDVSGENRVYLQGVNGELSPNGTRRVIPGQTVGRTLRWSGDSKRLYFSGDRRETIWSVEITEDGLAPDARPQLVVDLQKHGASRRSFWDVGPDGAILFSRPEDSATRANRIEFILNWTGGLKAKLSEIGGR
ncbi:MAG: hypothetical protein V3U11_10485, partial [Planctomycetota bacterium]